MTDVQPITLKKPDKVVLGILIAALTLLLIGVGWGLYHLLPVLVDMAKDTIILGVEVFVLLAIIMGFVQLWTMRDVFVYKMKLFAREARRKVAADNPIGTIDTSIEVFRARLEDIDRESVSADGALTRLKHKIRNRERTGMLDMAEKETGLCDAAERLGKPEAEISQHAVSAERWNKAAASVAPMVEDQEFIKGQLAKAREIAGAALADLENQRVVLAAQFDAYRESQAQAKAFRRFFGSSPELQMIDFAVEAIEKQTTDAQADIDQLMHQLAPRIAAAQLQRESEAAEALRRRAEAKQLAAAQAQEAITLKTAVTNGVKK